MGLCASTPIVDEEAAARTLEIEKMCEDSFRESCESLNMLCLGPAASGKATFLKQMVTYTANKTEMYLVSLMET